MSEEEEQQSQEKMRKTLAKRIKQAQLEEQKREIARKYLEADAYERLMNVRMANRELYDQLISLIVSMIQSNRVAGKITDAQLRSILAKVTARPDTTIEFKHK